MFVPVTPHAPAGGECGHSDDPFSADMQVWPWVLAGLCDAWKGELKGARPLPGSCAAVLGGWAGGPNDGGQPNMLPA